MLYRQNSSNFDHIVLIYAARQGAHLPLGPVSRNREIVYVYRQWYAVSSIYQITYRSRLNHVSGCSCCGQPMKGLSQSHHILISRPSVFYILRIYLKTPSIQSIIGFSNSTFHKKSLIYVNSCIYPLRGNPPRRRPGYSPSPPSPHGIAGGQFLLPVPSGSRGARRRIDHFPM